MTASKLLDMVDQNFALWLYLVLDRAGHITRRYAQALGLLVSR